MPPVSQTQPGWKDADRGHRRDRQRTGWLRLGDRETDTAQHGLTAREALDPKPRRSPVGIPSKSWAKPEARSRPGEPSIALSAGSLPTLATRQRKLRDASGSAVPNPRIRA